MDQRIIKILNITEWIVFFIAVAITLAPIYSVTWYHTGDGPSHLYSATVLNDILFHSGKLFGNFFDLHLTPVPNTTILLFQAILLEFIRPNIVLEITVLCISVELVVSYIYFVKSINPNHKGVCLLILPMSINFFTIMGFFNFSASLGLLFFTIGYFNKKANNFTKQNIGIIVLLITINWFTHLTGAIFTLGYIALYFLLSERLSTNTIKKFLLIASPAILLTILFGREATHSNNLLFETFANLQKFFLDFSPLISYHSDELSFMRSFQYLIFFLLPISLFFFLKKREKRAQLTLLIFCLLLIIAFFIAPINFFSGGFINYRILVCFLLFFCAFIESYSPRYLMLLITPIILFILVKKKEFHNPISTAYSQEVQYLLKNTDILPQGKSIIAMNYSDNWLHYNICLYPAIANKVVILDNQEAATPNSIIRWKKEKIPGNNIGNVLSSNHPFLKLDYEKETHEQITGLIRWQYKQPNNLVTTKDFTTDSIIRVNFIPYSNSDGMDVFLRK